MAEKARYQTKHKKFMQEYLEQTQGSHFTAADAEDFFRHSGHPMGKTTIYRQLEEFLVEGLVKKYYIDESVSACYEYVGQRDCCRHARCYHLKCEKCGKLFHLECEDVHTLEEHIAKKHGFRINPGRTVLYGICEACENTENTENEGEEI